MLAFPAAAASTRAKTATARKSTAKKTTTRKTAVKKKPAVKKKKPAAKKKKVVKKKKATRIGRTKVAKKKKPVKKEKIRIRSEDRLPKKPATSFGLFYSRFLQTNPVHMVKGSHDRTPLYEQLRAASHAWKALTDDERQAFQNESKDMYEEWKKKRDVYFATTDRKILLEINRRRKLRGKPKIHLPKVKTLNAIPPFMRFMMDFRKSPDGHDLKGTMNGVEFAKAAGVRWRMMTDDEKKSYTDAYHREAAANKAST